ncbi:dihydroxyacetone kinase phosphoryl donor subunit DhaM [Schaalia vaccimaxillae]|uniref:dihydroxyacetone kinase phosphoryl donor subunit DhaM n=1 Tax=Schaalia vaccimaxillae TaxID=183916 RepID=UPI0003B6C30B|nr:dihydroxyacetone kinase phosphoryl donor subunit DhaM [Schaalia vaccimaxillae]
MPAVAFVIVSHSDLLARGVVELAAQMAPDVHFEAVGGNDDGGIGTSYDRVEAAIEAARTKVDDADGAGVLVLTDIGSSTMTVESVLEFVDDPDHVQFVEAPLVEGTVAGAVRAQLGNPLGQVAAAARGALSLSSSAQGEDSELPVAREDPSQDPEGAVVGEAVVADPVGLHARPAALLARKAASFDADIKINTAEAASVLEVMSLGIQQGETVRIVATGPQAREAVAALVEMLQDAG